MSAAFDHDTFQAAADNAASTRQHSLKGGRTMRTVRGSDRDRMRRALQAEYRVLQVITFPIFLLIALLTFILPRSVRSKLPGLDVDGSLFARIRSIASASIPFVFMG